MIDDVMVEAELAMEDTVEHTGEQFARIRTGRANPQLVTNLQVEYYGARTPLQQLAGVSVPEPRMILVNPYDATALKEIERSIVASDLGVNPSNDGSVIRIVFPDLTAERRREYVKLARERAEEGRISVRNARRGAKTDLDALEFDGDITEDDHRRAQARLQDLTDAMVGRIDALLANKEAELLEV